MPTAIAYALAKFDSPYGVSDVDEWLGRKPGELPSREGMVGLDLGLLQHGYALTYIHPDDGTYLPDYCEEGSTLGYEDLKRATLAKYPGQLMRDRVDTYTKEMFEDDVAYHQQQVPLFEPYRASGQLTHTRGLDPDNIAAELQSGVGVAIIDINDAPRAVVIEEIRRAESGHIRLRYFHPSFEGPSEMFEDRVETLDHLLSPGSDITIIRPWPADSPEG